MATAVGVCLAVVGGCGAGGSGRLDLPDPVPVTGTVKLNDEPLVGATVALTPIQDGVGSAVTAVTDGVGKYELKPGAVPGEYRVSISRFLDPDGSPLQVTEATDPGDAALGIESLPLKYSDPAQTELKATVGPEGGAFDFELTSEDFDLTSEE